MPTNSIRHIFWSCTLLPRANALTFLLPASPSHQSDALEEVCPVYDNMLTHWKRCVSVNMLTRCGSGYYMGGKYNHLLVYIEYINNLSYKDKRVNLYKFSTKVSLVYRLFSCYQPSRYDNYSTSWYSFIMDYVFAMVQWESTVTSRWLP